MSEEITEGPEPGNSPTSQEASYPDRSTNNPEPRDKGSALAESQGEPKGWNSEESDHHRIERIYWKVTAFLTAVAAVGAIATTILSITAVRETRIATEESRRQANAADATLTISQAGSRPYILPQIEDDLLTSATVNDQPASYLYVRSYSATIHFTNFGNVPGIIKSIQGSIVRDRQPGMGLGPPDPISHFTTSLILAQGQQSPTQQWKIFITSNDAKDLVISEVGLFVRGEVIYFRDKRGYSFLQILLSVAHSQKSY